MKRSKTIRIVKGAKMEEGVILPEYKTVHICPNYGKRYFIGFEKRLQLNYCESYLIEWLIEQSNEEGVIYTDSNSRLKFINFILRISQCLENEILYKEETVKAAFKTLKRLELIIVPTGRRGWAWLNPRYFFRGNEIDRYRLIKDIENSIEGNTDSILYDKSNLDREVLKLEQEYEII